VAKKVAHLAAPNIKQPGRDPRWHANAEHLDSHEISRRDLVGVVSIPQLVKNTGL
jgi:hypothetical protein